VQADDLDHPDSSASSDPGPVSAGAVREAASIVRE
jgi:hypothetical protein